MAEQQTLMALFTSPLATALLTVVVSSLLGSYSGLRAYRRQSSELIDGAITWQWTLGYQGLNEEPYLVIQNRSAVPAYIIRARYLRGLFARREADKFAFSYDDPTRDSLPLEIRAQGVTSFSLSTGQADRIAAKAGRLSRWFGYLLKRPYVWIEIRTISGRRILLAANDATSFRERPLWLEGRWLKEPTPDWMKSAN